MFRKVWSFRLTLVHFNMCTVCSSGEVQTKFCLLSRFLNHVSCYSFNGRCDPFLQVLAIPYLLSIHNVLNVPLQEKMKWREVARFPDAWIGRGGPIPWPPRSPDLSPLDFFPVGVHYEHCVCWEDKEYPAPARKDHISHWNRNTRHDSEK